MNKLLLNIIKELLDMNDTFILPVWTIQNSNLIICSYCGALSSAWHSIIHDSDCVIPRAIEVLRIYEE